MAEFDGSTPALPDRLNLAAGAEPRSPVCISVPEQFIIFRCLTTSRRSRCLSQARMDSTGQYV